MTLSSVVLPQPEAPSATTNSSGSKSRLTSVSAVHAAAADDRRENHRDMVQLQYGCQGSVSPVGASCKHPRGQQLTAREWRTKIRVPQHLPSRAILA